MTIAEPERQSRQPYVEEVPESQNTSIAIIAAPPQAPSPPPSATPHQTDAVNVFDFLVDDETPNASRVSLGGSQEQMCMVKHAPPVFKSTSQSPTDVEENPKLFEAKGYSYGAQPVSTKDYDVEYRTPGPKKNNREVPGEQKSTDKKRKRQVEDLDLTQARRSSQELDEEMADAESSGPPVLHSGLTGPLNKLLSQSKFPPSPDYSGGSGPEIIPISPVKRKRPGSVTVEKTRGRSTNGQLVKIRKVRRLSDESRPRKHHRAYKQREHDEQPEQHHPKRAVGAIEYPRHRSPDARDANQLVVYRNRAEMFLSFVTKGPESESGCSMNKALKRYHRERGDHGLGKQEEEKELWKSLRLRRNERGEVVVLFSSG